jgi:hypothetical protein
LDDVPRAVKKRHNRIGDPEIRTAAFWASLKERLHSAD